MYFGERRCGSDFKSCLAFLELAIGCDRGSTGFRRPVQRRVVAAKETDAAFEAQTARFKQTRTGGTVATGLLQYGSVFCGAL